MVIGFLPRLVQGRASVDIRVHQRQVERCNIWVLAGDRDKAGTVDGRIVFESGAIGLNSNTAVAADVHQRNVSRIKLIDEHGVSRSIRERASCCDVAVVGSNCLVDIAPRELNTSARVRKRDRLVVADCGTAVVADVGAVGTKVAAGNSTCAERVGASGVLNRTEIGVDLRWIWLINNCKRWEILPCQASGVCWAA